MSLKAELDAFRAHFMARVPAEIREAMERADMELAASGILEPCLESRRESARVPLARTLSLSRSLLKLLMRAFRQRKRMSLHFPFSAMLARRRPRPLASPLT
jgi:hypothetical protein